MTRVKVVGVAHLPARLPVTWTATVWLVFDRVHPSPVFVGFAWTIVGIVWLVRILAMINQKMMEPGWQE